MHPSRLCAATALLVGHIVSAADPPAAHHPDSAPAHTFSSVWTSQTRQTFAAIRQYLAASPNAVDRTAAEFWLLETARQSGLEADLQDLSEQIAARSDADLPLRQLALSVAALGAARSGDVPTALDAWDRYLETLRLRQPNAALDLAPALALPLQRSAEPAAARQVYERLSRRFFLNVEVRDFCTARLSRLELLSQPAPPLAADAGSSFSEQIDLRGRVVVVDFWATTCRPCLEELPRLRRVHAEFQSQGVEFIGVSFDEDAAAIEQFRETQPVPWPQVLHADKVAVPWRVTLIPCLIVLDRQGRIAAVDVPPAELRRTLEALLRHPS
jgi:thiol-disulfide isomerase/thioredoxin